MFTTIRNAWKIKELRNKILFTLLIVLLYRIGNVIYVPFANVEAFTAIFQQSLSNTVLGLYNAAGPGQALDESLRQRLLDWDTPCHLRIFVSLSCTLCPELVTAAQRLATLNPRITTDVYDLNLYPALREAYQVMSVPCFLINEDGPHFGKKTAAQLLDLMEASRA